MPLLIKKLKLRDIKKGQVFWEEDMGMVVHLRAEEDAREIEPTPTRDGYECRAKVIEGRAGNADEHGVVTLFESREPGGYGLRLYSA